MNYDNYDHQAYINSHKLNKFKVGDWVTTVSGSSFQLLKQNPHAPNNFCVDLEAPSCSYYSIDVTTIDCKPWKPAEGEWCWFYGACKKPSFGQFIRRKGDRHYLYSTVDSIEYNARRCEPFIGNLPSWCK